MGNEFVPHLATELNTINSAAAVASLTIVDVPDGEMWYVSEVDVYHDDPAGATLLWRIVAIQSLDLPLGAIPINTHVRLSSSFSCPFWLPPNGQVIIVASGALAAGKLFYGCRFSHKVKGVPAGSYL